MGTRAIPAWRMLAAHAASLNLTFTFEGLETHGEDLPVIEPLIVFSPSMYLPAVIAKAEALARFSFSSVEMLGVRRAANDLAVLGVEADVLAIDGSPAGILRGLLLARASEQVFDIDAEIISRKLVDLSRITAYYRGEGAAAVRGERDDLISADVSRIDWIQ